MTIGYPDKKRYAYIYCNSVEEKKRFEKLAKEAGVSTSKFLLNAVENGLNPPPQPVSDDVVALSEDLEKTRDELRIARILIERYQVELQKVKEAAPSLQINRNFLDLFRKAKRPLTDEEICYELTVPKFYPMLASLEGLDDLKHKPPINFNEIPTTTIETIARQLETLESIGLITKYANGWAWNG
ncbi:MAG: hypothetical protein MUO26_10245 [Methanotrichaceae archaeon]|nr:hypothetical protein [Methanotrichaceae archaeon]